MIWKTAIEILNLSKISDKSLTWSHFCSLQNDTKYKQTDLRFLKRTTSFKQEHNGWSESAEMHPDSGQIFIVFPLPSKTEK